MAHRNLSPVAAQFRDDILARLTLHEICELLAEIEQRIDLMEEAELANMLVMGTA